MFEGCASLSFECDMVTWKVPSLVNLSNGLKIACGVCKFRVEDLSRSQIAHPHLLVGGPFAGSHQQGAPFQTIFCSGSDRLQPSQCSPIRYYLQNSIQFFFTISYL